MSVDIEIPPIEHSLLPQAPDADPLSVEQRYYTRYYTRPLVQDPVSCVPPTDSTDSTDSNERKSPTDPFKEAGLILVHSNRICLVCLSPHHTIHRKGLKVERLNFQVTNRINRLDNLDVKGKSKRGAQVVDENAILAWIECDNGERYPLRSQVKGKLIEINPKVIEDPQIMVDQPFGPGFVAIIMPKLPEGLSQLKERMVTEDEFKKLSSS